MQELKDAIINETFPHTKLVHFNSGTKGEELNASSMMKLIKEVFVKKNDSSKSKNLDNVGQRILFREHNGILLTLLTS
jgi:hypothetical protein